MIDSILLNIKTAYAMLAPVVTINDNQKQSLQNINSALEKFYKRVDEENMFLKSYLKTDRSSGR